jgi:tetratricopeptide (TPR) repeat protein
MKVFLSCVSGEFRSYRLRLANQLGALRGQPYEVKVQEDFEQGGFTLLDKLADYVRECDLVIHLAGDICGARPTPEHVRTLIAHLGVAIPDPLPEYSYTQWEYELAIRFERRMYLYVAAAEAPRDNGALGGQAEEAARLQAGHRERFAREGKHFETFTGPADLVRRVFYDLGLQSTRKIDNLPFKSMGTLFKGREEFLAQLHETLGAMEHRGHQRGAAITATATAATVHGLGGIGKTRAALEYAHRYADEYTALLFVQADSPAGLEQNLALLCGPMVLNLAEKEARERDVQVAAVLEWLQRHPGWFLILDNVDSDEAALAVQSLLARLSRAGQVVITSRLSNWEGAVEALALDILSVKAAADFLLERTGAGRRKLGDDDAQAQVLAVELGQLALALEQASAYIVRYRSTFAGYLEEWQQKHQRVLEWFNERLMQYPRSVATTWQTSFDRLSEPARGLLRLLSWLAPDPIPESLLEACSLAFAPGEASRAALDLRDALAELADHSLVKRSDDEPAFSVHRLVQDATRRTLPEAEILPCVTRALQWVNEAFKGDPTDVRDWPVLEPLLPHARAAVGFADERHVPEPTARLMNQVGSLLKQRAQFTQAEPLCRRALAIDEDYYGPCHPNVATDLNNLAGLLQVTDHRAEAEPLWRRALAIDEDYYGPHHPSVATDLNNLAQLLQDQNQLAEAEPLMRRALSIDEDCFGSDHPNVAVRLSNLAGLLQVTNRVSEAEPLLGRALAIWEQCFGSNDPNVASCLNNLAQLFKVTNRLTEAEKMMRRALEINENFFGLDHPSVAVPLNNLALLLKDTGRFAEADQPLRRALAIWEQSLGKNHPNVAACLNVSAQLSMATGRPLEAEPMMRRALAIDERSFGPDHPNVAIDLNSLARVLQATGRPAEAALLVRRALAIDEESYESDHPIVVADLLVLASLLQDTDRPAESEPLLRRAINAKEKSRAEDPQLAVHLNNHALVLRTLNRYDEAAAQLQRAIGIEDRLLPPEHPIRAHRRNNLAIVFMLANRLDEAISVADKAWLLTRGRRDVTSGRILFVRIALSWLRNEDPGPFSGQLRTMLAEPELPCLGWVARRWDVADLLDRIGARLGPEKAELLAALVMALNEPSKIGNLERIDLWKGTAALPLDAPRPEEGD